MAWKAWVFSLWLFIEKVFWPQLKSIDCWDSRMMVNKSLVANWEMTWADLRLWWGRRKGERKKYEGNRINRTVDVVECWGGLGPGVAKTLTTIRWSKRSPVLWALCSLLFYTLPSSLAESTVYCPWARVPAFKSRLLLTERPWTVSIISLCLSLPIYKVGIIIPISEGCSEY